MKRKDALALIRFAGYHGNSATALRIYVENRISFQAYQNAYQQGYKLRIAGTPCTCPSCQSERKSP